MTDHIVDENGLEMTTRWWMWDWTGPSWRKVIVSAFQWRNRPRYHFPGNMERGGGRGLRWIQRLALARVPTMESGFGPDYLPQEKGPERGDEPSGSLEVPP